jgi:hypothetical protein
MPPPPHMFEEMFATNKSRDILAHLQPLARVDWKMAPRAWIMHQFQSSLRSMLKVDKRGILCHSKIVESLTALDLEDFINIACCLKSFGVSITLYSPWCTHLGTRRSPRHDIKPPSHTFYIFIYHCRYPTHLSGASFDHRGPSEGSQNHRSVPEDAHDLGHGSAVRPRSASTDYSLEEGRHPVLRGNQT